MMNTLSNRYGTLTDEYTQEASAHADDGDA